MSNLRPIHIKKSDKETALQEKLRVLRQDSAEFNQKFWAKHNQEFDSKRKAFVKKILEEKYPNEKSKSTINAQEMSEFYKTFLDAQWKSHIDYNVEWQKRNFQILFLAYRVKLEGILQKFVLRR